MDFSSNRTKILVGIGVGVSLALIIGIVAHFSSHSSLTKRQCKFRPEQPGTPRSRRVASSDARALVELQAYLKYRRTNTDEAYYLPLEMQSVYAQFQNSVTAQLTIVTDCATMDLGLIEDVSRPDAMVVSSIRMDLPSVASEGDRQSCLMHGWYHKISTSHGRSYTCDKQSSFYGFFDHDTDVELVMQNFRYELNKDPSATIKELQFGPTDSTC